MCQHFPNATSQNTLKEYWDIWTTMFGQPSGHAIEVDQMVKKLKEKNLMQRTCLQFLKSEGYKNDWLYMQNSVREVLHTTTKHK